MDMRIGGLPLSTAQIALTAPDADGNPAGSQGRSWSFDAEPSSENSSAGKGFGWIADGGRDARPSDSDTYLTAMYEQYVNYRGPRRGTVDNPFAPVNVQTVVMTRPEGTQLDVRV
jgi:hypothetical protein